MSKGGRLVTSLGLFLVAVGLVVWAVALYLTPGVPGGVVNFTNTQPMGQPVSLTLQTVGTIGFTNHPTWVSYLTKDPKTGNWIHDNSWELPAHTVINVTVLQYDSTTTIRNTQFLQVTGTTGGVADLNGTPYSVVSPSTSGAGHTFTVPALGVNVPLVGATKTPLCGASPCHLSSPHNVITFSFKTPGPGNYNWQCFVPCGLGYLYGNGGPMSTQNFMGGFLDVVA